MPDATSCYNCHSDMLFHGGGRRGFDNVHPVPRRAAPKTVRASSHPTHPRPRASRSFRTMLHKIHMGEELANASTYIVNGFGSNAYPNNFTSYHLRRGRVPGAAGRGRQLHDVPRCRPSCTTRPTATTRPRRHRRCASGERPAVRATTPTPPSAHRRADLGLGLRVLLRCATATARTGRSSDAQDLLAACAFAGAGGSYALRLSVGADRARGVFRAHGNGIPRRSGGQRAVRPWNLRSTAQRPLLGRHVACLSFGGHPPADTTAHPFTMERTLSFTEIRRALAGLRRAAFVSLLSSAARAPRWPCCAASPELRC
jgi:hypothetical protein